MIFSKNKPGLAFVDFYRAVVSGETLGALALVAIDLKKMSINKNNQTWKLSFKEV